MPEENQGATVESPTATDVSQESSPAALAEAPAQQAVQEKSEVPFHEHPRWKELMEEREYYKQQLAAAINRPVVATTPQAVEQDPYAGMTPEEKAFYQRIEQIAEKKAQKIAAEKEELVRREINENRQIMATIAYERFQAKHPDVIPNSLEETQIAQLYQRGYSLEDAYKVAMFDKVQQQKVAAAKTVQTQKVQAKAAANVETSTIAANSGLPPQKKLNMREFVEEKIRNGEFVV